MRSILRAFLNILRKRYILALIFTISLVYCIVSLMREAQSSEYAVYELNPKYSGGQIKWNSIIKDEEKEIGEKNSTEKLKSVKTCRNSIQGRVLIADDKGYVCSRQDRLASGCCNVKSSNTRRFSCETCDSNQCCTIYEHCISCCLHPNKKTLLQQGLGKSSKALNLLFSSVTDHFELCLSKCRTSSQSVQHENSYRDPKAKHCYGNNPPPIKHQTNL